MGAANEKPLLLFTAQPAEGHVNPPLQVAAEMVRRGYEVVFITSSEFEAKVKAAGAEYVETPYAFADITPDFFAEVAAIPSHPQRVVFAQEHIFFKPMARRTDIVQATLERLREREGPHRQIIIVTESVAMSIYPFKFGRPLPKGFTEFPKTIGINIVPLWVQSVDVPPFLLGLPPDASEEGRKNNQALTKSFLADDGPWGQVHKFQDKYLKEAGATFFPDKAVGPLDVWLTSLDVSFQMCSPELEYSRSDLPSNIKFAGCLPRKPLSPDYVYPTWWSEVTENAKKPASERKKIVFVAQGTVATDLTELVVPTLRALSDRPDVLVIAALGRRGATLPEDFGAAPANARVEDYLAYDAVLEHADVFVTNGGYGGIVHAVGNAVPLVVAGETEDKNESSMRVEISGFGANLRTQRPTDAQVREGVERVLADPAFKRRAEEISKINEEMDCLSRIEKQIVEFTV